MRKLTGILAITSLMLYFAVTNVLASETFYTVQEGDTLWSIASNNGITVEELLEMNNLESDKIKPGDKLTVIFDTGVNNPIENNTESKDYCVQEGDSLSKIAQMFGTSVERLKYVNSMSDDIIYVGDSLIIPLGSNDVSRGGTIITGDRILGKAAEYLGTPYKYGGQSPGGFDCSGFVKYVFKQLGHNLPRTASAQFQNGISIEKQSLIPGDLVFFACGGSTIDHVGIYAGDNKFIHSSSPRSGGVIYSSLGEGYYKRYFVGARRVLR